jgi:methylthioxylose transferase
MATSNNRIVRALPTALALAIAGGVIAWAVLWGQRVQLDERVKLGAAPLVGEWSWTPTLNILPAVAIAIATTFGFSRFTDRLRWSITSTLAAVAGGAWTFTLAASDGFDAVLDPVVHPTEYWANLPDLPSAHDMIRNGAKVDYLLNLSVHMKGHPPGFPLMLKALDNLGIARPWVVGLMSWIGAAVVVAATMTCIRHVSTEQLARKAAPFLVLAPYAVWMGTSADAVFSAFLMGGLALLCSSLRADRMRTAIALSAGGGVFLGWSLILTYGAATFMVVPALVVLIAKDVRIRRRAVAALTGAAGLIAVLVTIQQLGFSWPAGLNTVRTFYWSGTAHFRPWKYFLVANVGVLFIALGAAPIAAFVRRKDRGLWLLTVSGLLCVAAANASQLSKGETERIWLIFFPLVMTATAVLKRPRLWLALQAGAGVVLQMWLISKW